MRVSLKPAVITTLAAALVATAGATASQSGLGAFLGKNGRIVFNDQSGPVGAGSPTRSRRASPGRSGR